MEKDEEFAGKLISLFTPNQPLPDPTTQAIGLETRYDWEMYENKRFPEYLDQFFALPIEWLAQIDTLILNGLEMMIEDGFDKAADIIAANKEKLPNLKHLYIGNVSGDEYEISWIGSTHISSLLNAFPQLETLKLRGNGAKFSTDSHTYLKTLIIESGGIRRETATELMQCHFPALEHLELWLGDENYGNGISVAEFEPLLSGTKFPNLKYLGLRNNDQANEYAKAIATAPIVKQLKVLDLSLGTLRDEGGKALLEAKNNISHLELLDLHFHYLSDEVIEEFKALSIKVDLSDAQEPEEYDDESEYYTFISE